MFYPQYYALSIKNVIVIFSFALILNLGNKIQKQTADDVCMGFKCSNVIVCVLSLPFCSFERIEGHAILITSTQLNLTLA